MNITPWIQFLIKDGIEQEWSTWFDCKTGGYGIKIKSNDWIGYRDLHELKVSEYGIAFVTGRTYFGERRNEYAWDELFGWNYERGAGGYYFNCNFFEISALSDSACMVWFNLCVYFCCVAHVATRGQFPGLCKGVNLGFMDEKERGLYDSNGFPNGTFRQQYTSGWR
jgi:hypothetical protein